MKTPILIILALFFGACTNPKASEELSAPNEMVINLTSDVTENAHSSLMGLHLAGHALDEGIKVTVFLNVDGVKLLLPGSDSIFFHGENVHELLNRVADNGGEVVVCPHCMEIHGLNKADVPPNYILGRKEVMIGKISKGPTVFTY